jgi:hypothetical protein
MEQCEYVFEERQETREMDELCEWVWWGLLFRWFFSGGN